MAPAGIAPIPEQPAAPDASRANARARLTAALAEKAMPPRGDGRLGELGRRFGLGEADMDLLGSLWAAAFEPELHAALMTRDPVQGQVTVLTVLKLFGHGLLPRLPSGSPLLAWAMVEEHALASGGAALTIDPAIVAWLDGRHELDRALTGRAEIPPLAPELEHWPIDSTAARIGARLRSGGASRVRISGGDATDARWFASAIGQRLGLPILALANSGGALPDLAVRLHRQAFLDNCIPFLGPGQEMLSAPFGLSPFPVQIGHGNGTPAAVPGVLDLDVTLEPPGPDARLRLWRRLVPESAGWESMELEKLALMHDANTAHIADVAARGPASAAVAGEMLRQRLREDAGPLIRRIDAAFSWDDLVLAEAVESRLREFAFEARERGRLWADPEASRLFPYGRGLVGLFAGPPGTGKTMAAQVIADDLGLDLMAVDLSAVISKWVGETAQNIQSLLSSPVAQRSILFFDEADAMFAKRVEDMRDAHDRFANFDSSHLMTAIEAYPGIVILATNLKGNIDTAFLRRIRHIVDFPRPDAAARQAIWQRAVNALFPRPQARKLGRSFHLLGRIEASGALIKNAALSALFAARRTRQEPTARLLAEMLARELGKEGNGISARDIDAFLEDGP